MLKNELSSESVIYYYSLTKGNKQLVIEKLSELLTEENMLN